jgi:hypothetical protein
MSFFDGIELMLGAKSAMIMIGLHPAFNMCQLLMD